MKIMTIPTIFLFVLLPIIDHLTKGSVQSSSNTFLDYYIEYIDPTNRSHEKRNKKEEEKCFFYYKSALYVFSVLQVFVFLFSLNFMKEISMNSLLFWLISFNSGLITAISMSVAHELYHKQSKVDKFFGLTLLSLGSYSHFYLQHLFCHHKHVATPGDPNTARFNETIYQFIPRSVLGGYIESWKMENGKSFMEHRMIRSTLLTVFIPWLIYSLFGFYSFSFFLVQSFISIVFVELVNYIEHYGLERKMVKEDTFEKVNWEHSWDAPYRFSW
jgi:alkane 1-monooxygenase